MAEAKSTFLAVVKGDTKDAVTEFKKLGGTVEKVTTEGARDIEKLIAAFDAQADSMIANAKSVARAGDRIGDALGPDLAKSIGQSKIDRLVRDLNDAGLEFKEIEDHADRFADQLRKMDANASALRRLPDDLDNVRNSADNSRSVLANMVGNSAQDVGELSGIAGTAGVAIGQMAEYAADGNISMKGLAMTAGPMLALGAAVALVSGYVANMSKEQKLAARRSEDVADALDDQIRKSYELATASDRAARGLDGLALGNEALTNAILQGDLGDELQTRLGALGKVVADTLPLYDRWRESHSALLSELLAESGLFSKSEADLFGGYIDDIDILDDTLNRIVNHRGGLELTKQQEDLIRAVNDLDDSFEVLKIDDITRQYLNRASAADTTTRSLINLAEQNLGISRNDNPVAVWNEFNSLLSTTDARTRDAILGTTEYADTQQLLADKTDAARQAIIDKITAMQEEVSFQRGLIDSTYAYEQGVYDTGNTLDEYGSKIEEMTAAKSALDDQLSKGRISQEDYNKALKEAGLTAADFENETRGIGLALVEQAEKYRAVLEGATLDSKEGTDRQIEALDNFRDTLDPNSPLRQFLDRYIASLESIPTNLSTTVTTTYVTQNGTTLTRNGAQAKGGTNRPGNITEVLEGGRSELLHENGRFWLMSGSHNEVLPLSGGGGRRGAIEGLGANLPPAGGGVVVNLAINGVQVLDNSAADRLAQQIAPALERMSRRGSSYSFLAGVG